jgi:hypothetical protein
VDPVNTTWEDRFGSCFLSSFYAPGNYNWDVMHWTTMWGGWQRLPTGYLLRRSREIMDTRGEIAGECHPNCRCSPPTRHNSMTVEHQAKQTVSSRSKNLQRSSVERRAPDCTMWRGSRALDEGGRWGGMAAGREGRSRRNVGIVST